MKVTKKEQLTFDTTVIQDKRFSIDTLVTAKLDQLSNNIHKLKYSDLVLLSRVEDFFIKYEYITEKQFQVLDVILKKVS